MNQILRLKDSIVEFLSPPAKRRRTLPATPIKREEQQFLTPQSELVDPKSEAAVLARIRANHQFPPDAKPSRKRRRDDSDDEDEVSKRPDLGVSPDDSISQIQVEDDGTSANSVDNSEELEDVDDEEAEEELSGDAKVEAYLARQAELAIRLEDIEKARTNSNLHPDALFLTERILMRSFEEIMPERWAMDFPTLPADLFTNVAKRQFINFNCLSSHAGVRALQSLLSLGERVQAVLQNDGPTERCITREVKAYIKWSERDGGYYNRRFLPVLVVVTARPGQSTDALGASLLGASLLDQLKFLAKRHREHLANPITGAPDEIPTFSRSPPILYGILIVQTFVVIFTYDAGIPNPDLLKIAAFDLKIDRSLAVWDCFGIAFTIICARNYLTSIKDEFEEEEEHTDPDL